MIDKFKVNNYKSIFWECCNKQYNLITTLVHENHCLVKLAIESEVNPQKMSTFCVRANDIVDILLEEPSDFTEVLKITMADRVPKQIMKDANDEYIT